MVPTTQLAHAVEESLSRSAYPHVPFTQLESCDDWLPAVGGAQHIAQAVAPLYMNTAEAGSVTFAVMLPGGHAAHA